MAKRTALPLKKSGGVACAVKNADDEDAVIPVHVINHVAAMWDAAKAGRKAIAFGAHVGEVREQFHSGAKLCKEAVSRFAIVLGNVSPDFSKVAFGLIAYTERDF